jgi:hypothetical protein
MQRRIVERKPEERNIEAGSGFYQFDHEFETIKNRLSQERILVAKAAKQLRLPVTGRGPPSPCERDRGLARNDGAADRVLGRVRGNGQSVTAF